MCILYLITGALTIIVLLYGISAILMSYLLSFWLKTPAGGFSLFITIGTIFGKLQYNNTTILLSKDTLTVLVLNY